MRSPCRELVRTLSDRGKTAWEIVETLEVILDMVHKYGAVILYAEAEKVLVSNRMPRRFAARIPGTSLRSGRETILPSDEVWPCVN